MSNTLKYRPAIDGLRAVSVISVLLYHLDHHLLPGGYIGVDVFFVISGFLITSIILKEVRAGSFSFVRFYQRRISRIFPQLFLVALVTLFASRLVYSPEEIGAVASAAVAAALSLANFKFALQGSYFDFQPDLQPLLHYWSLSVEEQFYMVTPLVIWMVSKTSGSRVLFAGLISTLVISLGLCIWMTGIAQPYAFYLLPTRAWELLFGSCLALMATYQWPVLAKGNANLIQGLGLAAILAATVLLGNSQSFPGFLALLPVVGAFMIIGWRGNGQSLTERLLSQSALVLIGKMSYALYLWHWPVFCLVDYQLYASSEFTRLAIKLSATVAFSALTYWAFESPTRRYLNRPVKVKLAYAICFVGIAAVSFVGYRIHQTNYNNVNVNLDRVQSGGFSQDYGDGRVVLMGDSKAGMYGKVIVELAEEEGFGLNIISAHSNDPFPGTELWKHTIEYIRSTKPEVVVYSASWGSKGVAVEASIARAVEEILEHCQHLIIINEPPILPANATRARIRKNGPSPIFEAEAAHTARLASRHRIRELASEQITVIEVADLFLNQDGTVRFSDELGQQMYYDKTHLSYFGALLVKDRLRPVIDQTLSLKLFSH